MFKVLNHSVGETYKPIFDNETEARHWIINHCNLSDDIVIRKVGKIVKMKLSDQDKRLAYQAAYFKE